MSAVIYLFAASALAAYVLSMIALVRWERTTRPDLAEES